MGDASHAIVIVGGGPAGLSTWLHLHALAPALAADTLLIERATYPRDKPCGGGVTRLGLRILGALGVDPGCASVSVDTIELRFGRRTMVVRQREALRVFRRDGLDHALARAAVERGLTLHDEESFTGFERVDGGLQVTTSRGVYKSRVLIGADGVFSRVRRSLAVPGKPAVARLIETIGPPAPADASGANAAAIFDFRPAAAGLQGYVWHFPCLDRGKPAVNRGIYDSGVHAGREPIELKRVFADALHAAGLADSCHEWTPHPLRWLAADACLGGDHVLLVGDAAGVDAALGEGIAPALDYGDFAANCLLDAFARSEFDFTAALERLAAHPLGRSLAHRRAVAYRAYAGGADALAAMPELIASCFAS